MPIRKNRSKVLDLIADDGPMGIALVCPAGEILWCNERLADFLAYDSKELIGKTFQELTHPDDLEKDVELYTNLNEGLIDNYSIEKRYIRGDGEIAWGRLFVSLVAGESKPYAVGMVYDITKDKQHELELEDEASQYKQAIDCGRVGLWIWDPATDDLYWNDIMLDLFGISREDFGGKGFYDFFDSVCEYDRPRIQEAVKEVIDKDEHYYAQFCIRRRDNGEIRHIMAHGGMYTSKGSGKRLMLGTNMDISDLQETKQQLEDSKKELESFAYAISHDLKAPLRGVDNLAQWITEDLGDQLPEDVAEKMRLLRERVQRMQKLIDGLLEYSRIGRVSTTAQLIESKTIIENAIGMHWDNGKTTFDIKELPIIEANPTRFGQIISNLIDNAVKHNKNKSVTIEIGCSEKDGMYEFYVKDNGTGIAKKYHEKIFDMFSKLTPKDDEDGIGVGLPFVKRIVEQSGGQIRVESKYGQGATFFFTWPKKEAKE